jgi:hypothetical protein
MPGILSRRRFLQYAAMAGTAASIRSTRPGEAARGGTIVYIHGLDNKPPPEDKEKWVSAALAEGLTRNVQQEIQIKVALAYWADLCHDPLDNPSTMSEPYKAVLGSDPFPRYLGTWKDVPQEIETKYGGSLLDKEKELFGIGRNAELLLGVTLTDLGKYYDQPPLRDKIRERLRKILVQHTDGNVFLIAHSMGSIIAYDVLCRDGHQIEHFVTIGCPLGLPLVKLKILEEFGGPKPKTPANVRRWTNLADPRDKVAHDCRLKDDYIANAGGVQVQDVLVSNEYVVPGNGQTGTEKRNRHKSYGYLRTPELSELLRDFLK